MKIEFVIIKNLTKKNEKYAFKTTQQHNEKINLRDFCIVEKRIKNFTILNINMKFTRC